MRKINLWSDLHLEFTDFRPTNNSNADYLFLAGDICLAAAFTKKSGYDAYVEIFNNFFRRCSELYKEVYYIMGNHEHYRGKFDDTARILRMQLPSNVHLLDNEVITIGGYRMLAGTMWTKFTNPLSERIVATGLNDYRMIKRPEKYGYGKLLTSHTEAEFDKFVKLIDNVDIVMSHHAPSELSIHPDYGDDYHLNEGYFTDMYKYMKGIKLWVHGHVHYANDYLIDETRVVCNPRGYGNQNTGFSQEKVIEL